MELVDIVDLLEIKLKCDSGGVINETIWNFHRGYCQSKVVVWMAYCGLASVK